MLAFRAIPEGLDAIRVIVVVLAIAGVIFWRAALRIIIVLFILLVLAGAVALIDGFLRAMK